MQLVLTPQRVLDVVDRIARPTPPKAGVQRGYLRLSALDWAIAYAFDLDMRHGIRSYHLARFVWMNPEAEAANASCAVVPIGVDAHRFQVSRIANPEGDEPTVHYGWNGRNSTASYDDRRGPTRALHEVRSDFLRLGAIARFRERLRADAGFTYIYNGDEAADVIDQLGPDSPAARALHDAARAGLFEDIADDLRRLREYGARP